MRALAPRLVLVAFWACGCAAVPVSELAEPGASSSKRPNPEPPAAEVLWPGVAVGSAYQAGEVRQFELTSGGAPLGTSWGRYVGPDADEHVFETRIELRLPGRPPVRSQGELRLDDAGHVRSGYERSAAAELRFRRRADTLVVEMGQARESLSYDPARGPVSVMAHTAILHQELMLTLSPLVQGAQPQRRLLSLSGGRAVLWDATVAPDTARGGLRIDTSLGEQVHVRNGRIVEVEVPDEGLVVRAHPEPQWPQWSIEAPTRLTYALPSHLAADPVELPGRVGEAVLHGEVVRRQGATGTGGGAVMLMGAGRQDRYGFSGPPAVDLGAHALSDHLARLGLAVLRYDERGFGQSPPAVAGYADQVEDARRATRTLLVQDGVPTDKIIAVGHGEAGWRALQMCVDYPDFVAGVLLLATPARPYAQVLEAQIDQALAAVAPELRARAKREQQRMIAAVLAGGSPPPELADQADWLREIHQVDPQRLVSGCARPMQVVLGAADFELDVAAEHRAWKRHATKHRRLKVSVLPGVDHRMAPAPDGSSPQIYLDQPPTLAPVVSELLTRWLRRVGVVE